VSRGTGEPIPAVIVPSLQHGWYSDVLIARPIIRRHDGRDEHLFALATGQVTVGLELAGARALRDDLGEWIAEREAAGGGGG